METNTNGQVVRSFVRNEKTHTQTLRGVRIQLVRTTYCTHTKKTHKICSCSVLLRMPTASRAPARDNASPSPVGYLLGMPLRKRQRHRPQSARCPQPLPRSLTHRNRKQRRIAQRPTTALARWSIARYPRLRRRPMVWWHRFQRTLGQRSDGNPPKERPPAAHSPHFRREMASKR